MVIIMICRPLLCSFFSICFISFTHICHLPCGLSRNVFLVIFDTISTYWPLVRKHSLWFASCSADSRHIREPICHNPHAINNTVNIRHPKKADIFNNLVNPSQGAKLQKITGFPFGKPALKIGFPQLFQALLRHSNFFYLHKTLILQGFWSEILVKVSLLIGFLVSQKVSKFAPCPPPFTRQYLVNVKRWHFWMGLVLK